MRENGMVSWFDSREVNLRPSWPSPLTLWDEKFLCAGPMVELELASTRSLTRNRKWGKDDGECYVTEIQHCKP